MKENNLISKVKPMLKNIKERVKPLLDTLSNAFKKLFKSMKKMALGTAVAVVVGTSLVSCSAEVNIPPSAQIAPEEQVIEQHDGQYRLTVSNLTVEQRNELYDNLPADYKQYAQYRNDRVIISNIEEYDFVTLTENIDYENAQYSLIGEEYSVSASNLTLQEINSFVRQANFRNAEMTIFRIDDNNFNLKIENILDTYDLEKAKQLLKEDIYIAYDMYEYLQLGEKEQLATYYNSGSNTLSVVDQGQYYNSPNNWLDIDNMADNIVFVTDGLTY